MIAAFQDVIPVLILPLTDDSGAVLERIVSGAGYAPAFAAKGEAPTAAFLRTSAGAVMLDAEASVPSSFGSYVRRTAASLIYFSASLSPYELATYARQRGVAHFPLGGSIQLLQVTLDETLAVRQSIAAAAGPPPSAVIEAARASVARATALLDRSRDVVIRSVELRATQRLKVAAIKQSSELLRRSVFISTVELRDVGLPFDRVLALVHDELARNATTHLGESRFEDVRAWCEEAYRVA
jgi:hypothetical protein